MTNRLDPKIQWFFDSLRRQETKTDYEVIVVDFHAENRDEAFRKLCADNNARLVPPKPCIWQGKHRVTSHDYWAASNARNTALCLAKNGYLMYVDDLSVLAPTWMTGVKAAYEGGYAVAGTYQKVKKMFVEDGILVSYESFDLGRDVRRGFYPNNGPHPSSGTHFYGCSCGAPVGSFLHINGWDEDCDSMSGEDYVCGIMLNLTGYHIVFDSRMMSFESEEHHHGGTVFTRIIKPYPKTKDASHAMLHWVLSGKRNSAPNYFGTGGIAALRQRIQAGEPFPIPRIPEHHWPDGQLISTM